MNAEEDKAKGDFALAWKGLQELHASQMATAGFSEKPFNVGEFLMLITSELAEALEWARHGNGNSDHIKNFLGIEEELADVVLRIMHGAERNGWNISQAVVAKMAYNATRPHKHSGKEF